MSHVARAPRPSRMRPTSWASMVLQALAGGNRRQPAEPAAAARRGTGRRPMKFLTALVVCLLGGAASAQTLDDLKNDGKNTDNILTYGMGYHLHRYSPLREINKSTVKRLVPAL